MKALTNQPNLVDQVTQAVLDEITAGGYVLLKGGFTPAQFQAILAATVAGVPGIVPEQLVARLQTYAASLPQSASTILGSATAALTPSSAIASTSTDWWSWITSSISANPWLWLGGGGVAAFLLLGRKR